MKRILFDVGHPGQVHQFKNLYWIFEKKGWECLFTAKDKDITIELLKKYNLKYRLLSKSKKGLFNKIINIPIDYYRFFKILKSFKPDIVLSRFSLHSAHISKLNRITNIAFSDTEHASLFHKLTLPFVDIKFTGESYTAELGKNHFKYNSNIEFFYLQPNTFNYQDSINNFLKLKENEQYIILRFVSWDAHHDIGQKGLTIEDKIKITMELSKFVRVFITSEKKLPAELSDFEIKIPSDYIHSVLSNAVLYIGEGGTMASESACLGVPSIYVNPLGAGVFDEQEEYGLLFKLQDLDKILGKAKAIISDNNSKKKFMDLRDQYLADKIDVLKFITWFIENFPESKDRLIRHPNYQNNFKLN